MIYVFRRHPFLQASGSFARYLNTSEDSGGEYGAGFCAATRGSQAAVLGWLAHAQTGCARCGVPFRAYFPLSTKAPPFLSREK